MPGVHHASPISVRAQLAALLGARHSMRIALQAPGLGADLGGERLVTRGVMRGVKTPDLAEVQELVARSLGASRLEAFLLVTLPQIRFSVVTGAVLAFLTWFDEIIVSLFVSGGDNSTLTRNMFNALRDQVDPTIAAISTIIIAVTTVLLVLTQWPGRSNDRRP